MRALEITLLTLMILGAIPVFAIIMPAQTGGIPTGSADTRPMGMMNLSALSSHQPPSSDAGFLAQIVDQANFYFRLFVTALYWVGTILFTIVWAYPALTEIFHINPTISAFIQIGIWFTYVVGWYQITKGDDWSFKR